jgi:hypothetical protein
MGKTGTSALQAFLAENSDILQKFGVLYPWAHRSMDDGGAHHALAIAMMQERPAWAPVCAEVSPEQMLSEIYREAVSLGLRRIVVSSEILYVIPPDVVRDLVRRFRSKVILYVRRQDMHLMSITNQAIKSQGKYCDATTVSCSTKGKLFGLMAGWMGAFSTTDLVFRPYERQQFVSGDLITDFLSVLGIPDNQDFRRIPGEFNQSLGRDALEYMNQVNAMVNDVSLTRAVGVMLVGWEQPQESADARKSMLLSPLERLAVIERYADLNSRIAREYLGREDGRLFYDPLPSLHDDWRPYSGLTRERAEQITAWLLRKDATLAGNLAARLREPSQRDGVAARQARSVLIPAVEHVCR